MPYRRSAWNTSKTNDTKRIKEHQENQEQGYRHDRHAAYHWLCRQRRHAPPNADVWDVRFRWSQQHYAWLDRVLGGHYRLSPMQMWRRNRKCRVLWSARDALVLKWVALQLTRLLPLNPHCHQLKGHGGVSGSLNKVAEAYHNNAYRYVYRTDIRGITGISRSSR